MLRRHIQNALTKALADTPVVFLTGPRQAGKSTLAQDIAAGGGDYRYLTLDDLTVLAAARDDPTGFIAAQTGLTILDEVQRAPELFLAIKAAVDRDRRPGRFLLTGSANIFLLPKLATALAGRMEVLTLWPLSQGEIEARQEHFVDAVFGEAVPDAADVVASRDELVERVVRGGFPEALGRTKPDRRRAWFGSYLSTVLLREVGALADIEGLTTLPRLVALLAARTSSQLNFAELSRSTTLPQTTLKRYFALLETTFLLHTLPAWSGNLGRRLVKSPKVHLVDSGLACHLTGATIEHVATAPELLGPLLESFVAMELRKQLGWSAITAGLFHFRSHTGHEVDLVLEDARGRVVGIEIKSSRSVRGEDLRGLRVLAEALGPRFHRGIVLHTGAEAVDFGPRLHAWPVSALWRLEARSDASSKRPKRGARNAW